MEHPCVPQPPHRLASLGHQVADLPPGEAVDGDIFQRPTVGFQQIDEPGPVLAHDQLIVPQFDDAGTAADPFHDLYLIQGILELSLVRTALDDLQRQGLPAVDPVDPARGPLRQEPHGPQLPESLGGVGLYAPVVQAMGALRKPVRVKKMAVFASLDIHFASLE